MMTMMKIIKMTTIEEVFSPSRILLRDEVGENDNDDDNV